LYFKVSVTSRELQTSRLGLVSAGEANVSVSSRSRAFTSRAHPWLDVGNCTLRYVSGSVSFPSIVVIWGGERFQPYLNWRWGTAFTCIFNHTNSADPLKYVINWLVLRIARKIIRDTHFACYWTCLQLLRCWIVDDREVCEKLHEKRSVGS